MALIIIDQTVDYIIITFNIFVKQQPILSFLAVRPGYFAFIESHENGDVKDRTTILVILSFIDKTTLRHKENLKVLVNCLACAEFFLVWAQSSVIPNVRVANLKSKYYILHIVAKKSTLYMSFSCMAISTQEKITFYALQRSILCYWLGLYFWYNVKLNLNAARMRAHAAFYKQA
ncbi:hypothetical protein ACJX0J_007156, partial [Zea mays]